MICGNTTKGQWNPRCLYPSLQNSSKAMCFWHWHCSHLHLVEGLRDAPHFASKIHVKDPQALAEVIRRVEKLNAAHQLTATLTPCTASMMSSDDKYFVCGWTGHFGHYCPDAQCYGYSEFSHSAQDFPPQDSSIRNAMPPWQILLKAVIHPQLEGQITLILWLQT